MARTAPDERRPSTTADLARYTGLGLSIAIAVALTGALGWWLDTKLSTGPWLLILGLFLGAGLAFYSLMRTLGSVGAGRTGTDTKNPPQAGR